jgi:hypothetical protein
VVGEIYRERETEVGGEIGVKREWGERAPESDE